MTGELNATNDAGKQTEKARTVAFGLVSKRRWLRKFARGTLNEDGSRRPLAGEGQETKSKRFTLTGVQRRIAEKSRESKGSDDTIGAAMQFGHSRGKSKSISSMKEVEQQFDKYMEERLFDCTLSFVALSLPT